MAGGQDDVDVSPVAFDLDLDLDRSLRLDKPRSSLGRMTQWRLDRSHDAPRNPLLLLPRHPFAFVFIPPSNDGRADRLPYREPVAPAF